MSNELPRVRPHQGRWGCPGLPVPKALLGGEGSLKTWLCSLARGCEVTPGLVPSLTRCLLGGMLRPVSVLHWQREPGGAEGWGSVLGPVNPS